MSIEYVTQYLHFLWWLRHSVCLFTNVEKRVW